jgi:hypothetical protein
MIYLVPDGRVDDLDPPYHNVCIGSYIES